MSYAQGGLIEYTDYNNFIGPNPGTAANKLNTVWATGGAGAGYGQTSIANIAQGDTVGHTEWTNFIRTIANAAAHQGSSIIAIDTANVTNTGNTVTYLSAISTNLTTIYNNKFSAASQGTTSSKAVTTTSTWSNNAIFTHTATFANGDAARYFFNSGGQLTITCSHPTGTGSDINVLFNNLASNVGTVTISAMNTGTANISGTTYSGVTKIGGGGAAPTISSNKGYFGLTTTNAAIFTQNATTGPSNGYSTQSYINITAKTNGTQGTNNDVGNVITLYTTWDEVPNGFTVATGSVTTLTVKYPESTNISNTWGTVTLTGSYTAL